VHEKAWVRILTEIFSTIVSPKFRRKIYHGMPCVPCVTCVLYDEDTC
jgi:Rho GTPase-activating protein 1